MNRRKNSRRQAAGAAVICAAGASTRMEGTKKEYCLLPGAAGGLTVLGSAVTAFAACADIAVIAIAVPAGAANGEAAARNALPPKFLEEGSQPAIYFLTGGDTRRASVFNALSFLKDYAPRFVLIHDGARPWVSPSLIERVIEGVARYHAVIPLLPLTETPKETDLPLDAASDAVFIKQHLKRAVVGAAQTPQGFAFPEILAAHEQAAKREGPMQEFTDDAEVWACFCGPVAAIPGDPENRKITFPEDLCSK